MTIAKGIYVVQKQLFKKYFQIFLLHLSFIKKALSYCKSMPETKYRSLASANKFFYFLSENKFSPGYFTKTKIKKLRVV